MRIFALSLLCSLLLSTAATAEIIQGSLITQIRGITNRVTIRSSSNPAIEEQPEINGVYRIDVVSPARDYILITPKDVESNLYSPRVIPAALAGKDTLYIIPPTNPSLTIFVENKTEQDFQFIIDKCIVLNASSTAGKNYELTIIPQSSTMFNILIAGITTGYPAVVKSVAVNPAQRSGILTIEPQDIGIQLPTPVPFAPVVAPPHIESVIIEKEIPLPPQEVAEEKVETTPPIVYVEKTPSSPKEQKPAPQTTVSEAESKKQKEAAQKLRAAQIEAAQSAYYFSDRLVVRDRRNSSVAAFGGYQLYPGIDESTRILNYGLDLYNVRIFKKYFDLNAGASSSDQLDGLYYKGSLTWHHSPYASIDVAYKSAQENIWTSQYDVSQTSIGINGYYKSQSVKFQFGVGVRFQVDFGDFETYFPEHLENQYRYLLSFYLVGSRHFGHSTVTVLAGIINEALYASAGILLFRTLGVNYTFKNENINASYFTPFESELVHKLTVSLNFTLKNREKSLLR